MGQCRGGGGSFGVRRKPISRSAKRRNRPEHTHLGASVVLPGERILRWRWAADDERKRWSIKQDGVFRRHRLGSPERGRMPWFDAFEQGRALVAERRLAEAAQPFPLPGGRDQHCLYLNAGSKMGPSVTLGGDDISAVRRSMPRAIPSRSVLTLWGCAANLVLRASTAKENRHVCGPLHPGLYGTAG